MIKITFTQACLAFIGSSAMVKANQASLLELKMAVSSKHMDKYATLVDTTIKFDSEQETSADLLGYLYTELFGNPKSFYEAIDTSLIDDLANLEASSRIVKGRTRLGESAPSHTFDFSSPDINVWTTSLFMAGDKEFSVLLDTATDLTAINGEGCVDCQGPTYDILQDLVEKGGTIADTTSQVLYGDTTMWGFEATGEICLGLD